MEEGSFALSEGEGKLRECSAIRKFVKTWASLTYSLSIVSLYVLESSEYHQQPVLEDNHTGE